ncbi:MAG TPA: choice-of-anchor tandem repeat GloVer-containing protein [Candidatus Sulfotelmatobacter sp.]|nr:choice-of-anchor tandem repeat GloVer-containing protein [Candidatus Sulfotelmatobacter sp.]
MKKMLLPAFALLLASTLLSAQTYKFRTIYSFPSSGTGPSRVSSNLILDSAGNLYGVSAQGGQYQQGTVFKVTPSGTLSVLYSFQGLPDGSGPSASLFRDKAGNLYGTTFGGGTDACGPNFPGCGTVFKLTPGGQESILYRFTGLNDGALPTISVTADSAGNVYGATLNEVQAGGAGGNGDVYKIDTKGTFTILHSFCAIDPNCSDGQYPMSGLIPDASGNLYGSTDGGGQFNGGTIYKITPFDVESVLYSFPNEYESQNWGNLTRDSLGNFYGVTVAGTLNTIDGGKVFKVSSTGVETVPFSFCVTQPGCIAGDEPEAPLQIDKSGNIFGVVTQGGKHGSGGVFKLTPGGTEALIYNFPSGFSSYGVVMDPAGNLYGVSVNGGTYNAGAIYKLTLQ